MLRTTWHFVVPDDLVWLLELTGPALRKLYRQNQRGLGIDDETLDRAVATVVDVIAAGGPQTRAELRQHLLDRGLPAEGQALTLVTAAAEAAALVCSGPVVGNEHTHALVADRAPGARRLDREEALAELALRYVLGHGPATERDLAYWATLTLTDARRGVAAVADRLQHFEHDGRTYWHGTEPPATTEASAHLLQILDEMYRGYQDSRWVLDAAGVVPREREAAAGMALVDGQLVAAMKRGTAGSTLTFALRPFRPLTPHERSGDRGGRRPLRRLPRAPGSCHVRRRAMSSLPARRLLAK